jgi:hypothetical protein
VKPFLVRQVVAMTSNWIHVLGSNESSYLVPAVTRKYSYEDAYCDSAILNALGLRTVDAEVISLCDDLTPKTGLTTGDDSRAISQHLIGWRLPSERSGEKILQVLPSHWLSRVTNRAQFLEVLVLDLWFGRSGRREVVFRQKERDIEAIFLPSGNCRGAQTCTVEQVRYQQAAVYTALQWARIEADLKAKVGSLSLSILERQLRKLPEIGARHEVLKSLWFQTVVNKLCFDQCLVDAMGALFGGAVQAKHQSAPKNSAPRFRAASDRRDWYFAGCRCG